MTFTEAAVEVLRLVGKPLHYKKITEIAIERNLLSHVGKTPETTMSSRLATMVKKDRGDAPILKVKPGVFALREFSEEVIEAAYDATGQEVDLKDLPESEEPPAEPAEEGEAVETAEEEETSLAPQELPGADVFPEEEDDDELILANLDDDAREGRKARKRRSRRRRDREPSGTEAEARAPRRPTRREAEAPAVRAPEPGEAIGRDLADAIEHVLRSGRREPQTLVQVAESLIQNGRLSGVPMELTPTIAAAVRGDSAGRRASSDRPRFRELEGCVSLLEWDHPGEAVKAEQGAVRAAQRQQQSVRRAFIKRLHDLPDGALMELLATWLNAVGVHSLRGVRSEAGDFSLAGTLRRGPEETRLAITIYRGKQPINSEAVIGLRGALHQFDHARVGWLITLGQVRDGAHSEARAEGAAPCAVFDGEALAASMEEVGVGIRRVTLPLAVLDVELLNLLGGGERAAATDNATESDASRRRRSRRRGRRRPSREQDAPEATSEDSAEATEPSETPESAPAEEEPPSEPPEVKEETPLEAPVKTELEAEQL